jgi:lysophospholipase L1-like esterase
MSTLFKLILIGSLLFNILAIWGMFQFIMYGGSPLSDLKRRLTGTYKQEAAAIPYSEENAAILKEIADGKLDSLRVVFFGASITNAWDLKKYFPEFHPVNRGIGGLVPDLLAKYKSNVLDLKPTAVAIKICSVNFRPSIPAYYLKDGLQVMVQTAQAAGIIPIVTTVIPVGKPAARIGDYSAIDSLKAYNDWVREYARGNSLLLIDYAKAIENVNGFMPQECTTDAIHLTEKGYEIISKAARPVIHKALALD